jgi:dihydrofolate reductase
MGIVGRPQVSVFLGISLDGFIAGEGGDLAWLEDYSGDPPEATGYAELLREVDVLVMGRNTHDAVRGFDRWPYPGRRVVVLTHRSLEPRHGEERFDGFLPELLERLDGQGCRHAYLDGGGAVRQGLAAGVVDRLTLSWVPVILGKGITLFGSDLPRLRWRPEASRILPSGLVQVRYVAAGTPPSPLTR